MQAAEDTNAIASRAAASATPFIAFLITRYRRVVDGLRGGQDEAALGGLAELIDELEEFLRFLVLVAEHVSISATDVSTELTNYRTTLLGVLEGMSPALADADLVEVADAIEDDLIPQLHRYADLDDRVRGSVGG